MQKKQSLALQIASALALVFSSTPAFAIYPVVLKFSPVSESFKLPDGNLVLIEKTTKPQKKVFFKIPGPTKLEPISATVTYDNIYFTKFGGGILVDNSGTDKLIKWALPGTSAALTSVSFSKSAKILATDCAIGADATIACMLSGTLDNSIKVIPDTMAKTGKVLDSKTNQQRDIEDKDIKTKFPGNPTDLLVTDLGMAVWWQNNLFGKKISLLKKGTNFPLEAETTVDKAFALSDNTLVWYNKRFGGNAEITLFRPEFQVELEEEATNTEATAPDASDDTPLPIKDPSGDTPAFKAHPLSLKDVKVFSGGFEDLRISPEGHIFWWSGSSIKILYNDYWQTAEAKARAAGVALDTLTAIEKSRAILPYVEPREISANPKSIAINTAGTLAWAEGDQVKILRKAEEDTISVNEKADYVVIANNGTVAWTGHSFMRYWIKILLPGEGEARTFEHWVDGIAAVGEDTIAWWGNSDIPDGEKNDVIDYFALFGVQCYVPEPIAGLNGCSTGGILGQRINLYASMNPSEPPLGCYAKADLRNTWTVLEAPRGSKVPRITGTLVANMTIDPTVADQGYQGWYRLSFCANVKGVSTNRCDYMAVKVVGQTESLPDVPCDEDRSGGGLFNCALGSNNSTERVWPLTLGVLLLFAVTRRVITRRKELAKFTKLMAFIGVVFGIGCQAVTMPTTSEGTSTEEARAYEGTYNVTFALPLDYVDRTFYFYYPAELSIVEEDGKPYARLTLLLEHEGKTQSRNWSRIPIVNGEIMFRINDVKMPASATTLLTADTTLDINVRARLSKDKQLHGAADINLSAVATVAGPLTGLLQGTFSAEQQTDLAPRIKYMRSLE